MNIGNLKVSIITVAYNAANTIEQTILSVLNQSYENIEYIIIDGKSTDGTCDIIEKYSEFISCFISEPDEGIYDAMNKGIRCATGDVIGIINSDDWYETNAIEEVVNCFSCTDAELVYGNICYIFNNNEKKYRAKKPLNQIWYAMVVPHPSVFIKYDIYKKYGLFDKKYKISADYELLLRLYTKGVRFEYVDTIVANFRDGGISTVNRVECAKESRRIRLSYADCYSKKEILLEKIEFKYKEVIFNKKVQETPHIISNIFERSYTNIRKDGIVIFGAGFWGKRFEYLLKTGNIPIISFVDNDENKWNTKIENIMISPPDIIRDFVGYVLVAVRDNVQAICEQMSRINSVGIQIITLKEIMDKVIQSEDDIC